MILLQLCRSLQIYPEAYLCSQEQAASEEASELGQGRVHNNIMHESGVFHVPSMLSYVDVICLSIRMQCECHVIARW